MALPAVCLLVRDYPEGFSGATESASPIPCDRCRSEVWIGAACKRLFMLDQVYPICVPCFAAENGGKPKP